MFWARKSRAQHTLDAIFTTTKFIHERLTKMSKEIDDLNAAIGAVQTAVGDAVSGIKDLADKLGNASSVNPADVEAAAARLNLIATGLQSAVQAVGEPITPAPAPEPVAEPVPPAAAVAEGAEPNPPGSTTAGDPLPQGSQTTGDTSQAQPAETADASGQAAQETAAQ
jgi:hypothetical protein